MAYSIRIIEDEHLWESFLLRYASHALFQSWSWGNVQRRLGYDVWRYGFYREKTLEGIAQIVFVRARRGAFFHIRHGPILRNYTATSLAGFFKALQSLIRERRPLFVRMSPLIEDSDSHRKLFRTAGCMPAPIHAMDAERCWVLDLDKSEEELLAGMRKSTRYEIRRSQKAGVDVVVSTKADDIQQFLDLYRKTSDRHGFVPHEGIKEEFTIFSRSGRAFLLLGQYKGKFVAGAIILFCAEQGIYHHGASIPSAIPVSHLVQWEAIRESKKRGMNMYNFWGIAPDDKPKHPWRGITVFKKGFGGREIGYMHAWDLPVSAWYVLPRSVESVRRFIKGY